MERTRMDLINELRELVKAWEISECANGMALGSQVKAILVNAVIDEGRNWDQIALDKHDKPTELEQDIAEMQECVSNLTREELVAMAEPEYRLFEIDWTHDYPYITYNKQKQVHDSTVDMIGQRIEGFRIFGYTDDKFWKFDYAGSTEWHSTPCGIHGNHKYAIGRRE